MTRPEPKIACIVSEPFAENTYVAHFADRKDCLVFDPGLEPDKIFEYLDAQGLTPAAIVNTHGHGDHIGGNQAMKDRWTDCPIVIGINEAELLVDPMLNLSGLFGAPVVSPPADILLNEGDTYEAAGFKFDVYEIPGHSPGHVVYVWRAHKPLIVFGGDVLFAGSIGRTDFPGGDLQQLTLGIERKLFTLPDDTVVLSGHGPATTTGREKKSNPFVGQNRGRYSLDD